MRHRSMLVVRCPDGHECFPLHLLRDILHAIWRHAPRLLSCEGRQKAHLRAAAEIAFNAAHRWWHAVCAARLSTAAGSVLLRDAAELRGEGIGAE
jgi:hypothetical protein